MTEVVMKIIIKCVKRQCSDINGEKHKDILAYENILFVSVKK